MPPDEPNGPPIGEAEHEVDQLGKKLTVLRDALTREMQSVWAAEGRVYDVGKKLERVREQLAAAQHDLEEERARTEAAELRAAEAEQAANRGPSGMSEELAAVFRETEKAVAQILEESRSDAARAGEETARLAAWRDRVTPHVEPMREAVAGMQHEIEIVAGLINEALEPINAALTDLGRRLDTFLEASTEHPDEVVVDLSDREETTTSTADR
jgi:chromosome segregation ATPase